MAVLEGHDVNSTEGDHFEDHMKTIQEINGDDDIPALREEISDRLAQIEQQIAAQQSTINELRRLEDNRLEFAECTLMNQLERSKDLVSRIEGVNEDTERVMRAVEKQEVHRRNLEAVRSFIARLHSINEGIAILEQLVSSSHFAQASDLLLGLMQMAAGLEPLLSGTKRLRAPLTRLEETKGLLWNVIQALFKSFASVKGGFRPRSTDAILLAQSVLVIEVMGEPYRKRLIDWYVEHQLKGYKDLFRGNIEHTSLGRLNNRFHWLQRLLTRYREEHRIIFLDSWRVDQILCAHFCATTSRDISEILRVQGDRLDPEQLLTSIREAQGFEQSLAQMYPEADSSLFAISFAFEGHMGLFITLQEEELAGFIKRLPLKLEGSDIGSGNIVSSAELFLLLIRDSLQDILALGKPVLISDLTVLFNRYLSEYSRYLQDRLPKRISMGKKLKGPDVRLVCSLLSTADYCIEHCEALNRQLSDLLQGGNSPPMTGLDGALQSFHVLSSLCMGQMEQHLELLLSPNWAEMSNGLRAAWDTKHQVGDQSPYVTRTANSLAEVFQQIRRYISRPSTLATISSRLARTVVEGFRNTAYECQPISTTGAQQLIVDLMGLKRGLAMVTSRTRRASLEQEEVVQRELALLEGILKTILLPAEPAKTFIEGYLMLVADPSILTFSRVLDLRTLSKPDHKGLLEEFSRIVPEAPSGPLQQDRLGQAPRRTQISTTDQMINRIKNFDFEEQVINKLSIPMPFRAREPSQSPS